MSEKWSQERIQAWEGYLAKELINLETWKRRLKQHEEAVARTKKMVEFIGSSAEDFRNELAKQGVIK